MQNVEVLDLSTQRGARVAGPVIRVEPPAAWTPRFGRGLPEPWVAAHPGMEAGDLRKELRDRETDHVMVLEQNVLIGVLCSCDLDEASPRDPLFTRMSRRVITLDWRASLWTAARAMNRTGVGFLPVTDGHVVLGAIDRQALAEAGIPLEATGPLCSACGAYRHVALRRAPSGLRLCRDCADRAGRHAGEYFDLGEQD